MPSGAHAIRAHLFSVGAFPALPLLAAILALPSVLGYELLCQRRLARQADEAEALRGMRYVTSRGSAKELQVPCTACRAAARRNTGARCDMERRR